MSQALDDYIRAGERALRNEEFKEALGPLGAVLRSPLATPKQRLRALVAEGVAHSNLGDREQALALYEQALRLDLPAESGDARYGVAMAMRNRGSVLFDLGRWQESYEQYRIVVERFSADADAEVAQLGLDTTVDLANAAIELGRFDEAVNLIDSALQSLGGRAAGDDERVAVAMSAKGNALLRSGRLNEAGAVLAELIDNDPERIRIPSVAGAAYNVGIAVERQGNHELARAVYQELNENLSGVPVLPPYLKDILTSVDERLALLAQAESDV